MKKSLIVILLLISFYSVLQSCNTIKRNGYHKTSTLNNFHFYPVFDSNFEKALYNATITRNKKKYSSLVIIKRIDESHSYRLALLPEIGPTLIEMEFFPENEVIVHNITEYLDRKPVINTLSNDFNLLFRSDPDPENISVYQCEDESKNLILQLKDVGREQYYFTDNLSGPYLIEKRKGLIKKTTVDLFNYVNGVPNLIIFKHGIINLEIRLEKIQKPIWDY